ncbi:MAG: hypothetical protein ABR955_08860 [Verrucomicrobiota bacterium]|jgi:hypothetical protein
MSHAYTEDQLVEQHAIGLFAGLGWAVAVPPPNAGVVGEPRDAGLLGRETKGDVVLVSRLRATLERLNPALPPEAIREINLGKRDYENFTQKFCLLQCAFFKQTCANQN